MTIALYGSRRQDGYISQISEFVDALLAHGHKVAVERKLAATLNEAGYRLRIHGVEECQHLPEDTELVVSIGGDGTFLRSARWLKGREVPVLGINTGHLGFLAENYMDDVPELVEMISEDKWIKEKRMVLEASCDAIPAGEWPFALNEVAFLKGASASMINVNVEINGHFLAEYRADGLLMVTPTGSTAYNLSVGGPILSPTLNNIILSPIAPHTLTLRPVVVGGEEEIRATVSSRVGEFRLSIDGKSFSVPCGKEITVKRAAHSVLTLRRRDKNFAHPLSVKLLWGH